jgi:hypothetical protein
MQNRPSNKLTLITDADNNLLAAVVLWKHDLHMQSYYHFIQAIEKYLKVLLIDTNPEYKSSNLPQNSAGNPYIPYWGHDLEKLAQKLPNESRYDFYKKDKIKCLKEYSKYNEATKYSILGTPKDKEGKLSAEEIEQRDKEKEVKSFDSKKILKDVWELILKLRNDIQIDVDDYWLGIVIRGHHFNSPEKEVASLKFYPGIKKSVEMLKEIFPDSDKLVRWKKNS